MKGKLTKMTLKRVISLVLALVMVLGMGLVPAVPHAHAAEEASMSVNKTTFEQGEGVLVTATSAVDGDWVGIYAKDADPSTTTSYYWYYVNGSYNGQTWESGKTYNIFSAAPNGGYEELQGLAVGEYDVILMAADYTVKQRESISIVAVDAEAEHPAPSVVMAAESFTIDEEVRYTATSYKSNPWLGLYSGIKTASDDFNGASITWQYVNGRNGSEDTFGKLAAGDYTIVVFDDYSNYTVDALVTFTVTDGTEVKENTYTLYFKTKNSGDATDAGHLDVPKSDDNHAGGSKLNITATVTDPDGAKIDTEAWVGLFRGKHTLETDFSAAEKMFSYNVAGKTSGGTAYNGGAIPIGNKSLALYADDYSIVLFKDASDDVPVRVITFTIYWDDITETITKEATCEEDGVKHQVYVGAYSDKNSTKEWEYDIAIPALGHAYGEWTWVEGTNTHSRTCANDATHVETENCTYGDDDLCTVCGSEHVSVEVGRETVAPTCEAEGYTLITYADGTTKKIDVVPALGHAYTWTRVEGTNTHTGVCANDATHVETKNCTFENGVCTDCGGAAIQLYTDKAVYAYGEPILVSALGGGSDWVGIYKKGETYDPNAGGSFSIFWYYISEQSQKDVNILATRNENGRSGEFVAGEYTISLFTNDSYTSIATVDITVTTELDESKTVTKDATCTEDGSVTYYNTDGTVNKVDVLPKLGHEWEVGKYNGDETHTITCASCGAMDGVACTWDEGTVTTPATPTEKGVMTYTCTECGGTRTVDIPATGATEVKRETVAPNCEEQGYTLITYSDGSTSKIDFVDALGHDVTGATSDDYIHVEGTHTHKVKCQREGCGIYCMEDCVLETNGVLDGNGYYYACTKCGEWTENVILTDKAVYASGEDIIVTVHPNFVSQMGGKDWIGLYKKGETPSGTGVTSIRWDYAVEFVTGKSIFTTNWHDRPTEDVENRLAAGEYALFLCANDGYGVLAKTTITVTTELDESKTVRVEPTCTEDGTITYYNTDGTVNKVITAAEDESLKATGHSFGDWKYDGVDAQTHTHTCGNGCGETETEKCTWNEGEVTKEPSETEEGTKTYTCTACGGTKTEVLPKTNVTVTETETVPATCEEAGYIRTHYSDGTYSDEVLPALGHAYGDWTFNSETKTHARTCANDASHVITENCTITSVVSGNKVTHTCSVCNGTYETGLIETDKTTYGVTDPIMVTAYDTFSGAWVGLYKKDENPDPDTGGIESLFWAYITEDMVGKPFDLTAVVPGVSAGNRGEKLSNGEYMLYFFGNSGYNNIVAELELEVFTDMSNTEFELLFYKGEARENGYHRDFELKTVDNPAGGEKVTLGVNATGEVGSSWVGVYRELHDLETDYNGLDYILYRYVADINGKTPFSLNWAAKGGFDFEVGDYTIVIFADGGYDHPVKYITFTVYRPTVSETVRREPSCDAPGLKYVVYEDDNNDATEDTAYVVIPALGHDFGAWACVEGTNTHVRYCNRLSCGAVETEDCVFGEDKLCTACGGQQYHIHSTTKVEAKEATCLETGNIEYYTCECGAWFKDEAATQEITDKTTVETALAEHSYGAWAYDEATKTHTRTCALDATHTATEECTFGEGVVVEKPAGNKAGVKKFTCTVCGGSYTEEFTEAPASGSYERIYGADRYLTAMKVADQLKENLGIEKFQTVVVACGTDFADALSGSYLANQKNAPILLVRNRNQEMNKVKAYIQENLVPGGTVYILGGTNAVPAAMETGLESFKISRLGGATRYETNLLILKEAGVKKGDDILVCTGKDFADCLSASAVKMPILLVKDSLNKNQKVYLNDIQGGKLYIIGGKVAVNEKLETALGAYGTTERISGATRYYTSTAVAQKFFPDSKCAVLVYGLNFPDGLCGGALANSMNAPVILVANGKQAAAVSYAESCGTNNGVVLGGTKLISDAVAKSIFEH